MMYDNVTVYNMSCNSNCLNLAGGREAKLQVYQISAPWVVNRTFLVKIELPGPSSRVWQGCRINHHPLKTPSYENGHKCRIVQPSVVAAIWSYYPHYRST